MKIELPFEVGDTVQFNPDRFPLDTITRNNVCKKDTCQDVTNQEATCAHDWELVDELRYGLFHRAFIYTCQKCGAVEKRTGRV